MGIWINKTLLLRNILVFNAAVKRDDGDEKSVVFTTTDFDVTVFDQFDIEWLCYSID